MEPLIKWSGGKRRELPKIRKWYPKHNLYIEPFIGGAAVYFDLKPKHAVISDTHSDLINFYQEIKRGHGKQIMKLCNKYANNETNYYYIRDSFKPKNKTEKAFVFYYLRKTCFRGMLRYNAKGEFNIPWGRYKKLNFSMIINPKYKNVLKHTIILNKDYKKVLEKYESPGNFVFLDPPYDSEFTNYGFAEFGKKEHKELSEWFKNTKNKCLLVIGDTPYIRKIYEGYIKEEYDKKYAFKIYGGRIRSEIDNKHLIITNYNQEK